jgi:hypothetical protein
MKCIFDEVWLGPCDKEAINNNLVCHEHSLMKCSCGKQAIAQCGNTGFLVCGAPYCKECGKHIGCRWA